MGRFQQLIALLGGGTIDHQVAVEHHYDMNLDRNVLKGDTNTFYQTAKLYQNIKSKLT